MEKKRMDYTQWKKELDRLENGKSKYVWDEMEELITDSFDNEDITSEEYDELMHHLMDINCD